METKLVSEIIPTSELIPTLDAEDGLATFDLQSTGGALRLANTVDGDALIQTAEVKGFELESGSVLESARLGFAVYAENLKDGETPGDREVILLHPALTGTARFKLSDPKAGSQGDGWGSGWAGTGSNPITEKPYLFDLERYTVIGLDHFGGRAIAGDGEAVGSTSARELGELATEVILKDGVRLTAQVLLEQFGIDSVKAVVGGSMGGGQAFEWLFQDTVKVGHIFDISGCGTLDSNAKKFFALQADFLRDDRAISQGVRLLAESILEDIDPSRHTEGFKQAVDHVVSRFEEIEAGRFADPTSVEASKLFAVRQLGFLLFVTPEFFEEKRDRGIDVGQWLDKQGGSFARRFDSEGLACLCAMIADAPRLEAAPVAKRLLELNSTRLVRSANIGDTLFPAEQQFAFNRDIRNETAGSALFSEFFSNDKRNGHDRFFTKGFLADDAEFLRLKLEGAV